MTFNRWRSLAVHGPEDGGAGAGGADGAGVLAGGQGAAPPSFALASETRPDWLAETFYDLDTKTIRVDALGRSYGELHSKLGQKAEAIRAEVLADMRRDVPTKPEDYAVGVPEGLPEGFQPLQPAEQDGMLAAMRAVAHEAGMKPVQFQKLTNAFYAWQAAQMIDVGAEVAQLGEGGEARIQATQAFLKRHLTEQEWGGVAGMTQTAAGLQGLEKLMRLAEKGGAPSSGGAGAGGDALDGQGARTLMRTPAYKEKGPEGDALRQRVHGFLAAGGAIPRD